MIQPNVKIRLLIPAESVTQPGHSASYLIWSRREQSSTDTTGTGSNHNYAKTFRGIIRWLITSAAVDLWSDILTLITALWRQQTPDNGTGASKLWK